MDLKKVILNQMYVIYIMNISAEAITHVNLIND